MDFALSSPGVLIWYIQVSQCIELSPVCDLRGHYHSSNLIWFWAHIIRGAQKLSR